VVLECFELVERVLWVVVVDVKLLVLVVLLNWSSGVDVGL